MQSGGVQVERGACVGCGLRCRLLLPHRQQLRGQLRRVLQQLRPLPRLLPLLHLRLLPHLHVLGQGGAQRVAAVQVVGALKWLAGAPRDAALPQLSKQLP